MCNLFSVSNRDTSWITAISIYLGAFLAGIIVPREGGLAIIFTEKLEDAVSIIFLPLVSPRVLHFDQS